MRPYCKQFLVRRSPLLRMRAHPDGQSPGDWGRNEYARLTTYNLEYSTIKRTIDGAFCILASGVYRPPNRKRMSAIAIHYAYYRSKEGYARIRGQSLVCLSASSRPSSSLQNVCRRVACGTVGVAGTSAYVSSLEVMRELSRLALRHHAR